MLLTEEKEERTSHCNFGFYWNDSKAWAWKRKWRCGSRVCVPMPYRERQDIRVSIKDTTKRRPKLTQSIHVMLSFLECTHFNMIWQMAIMVLLDIASDSEGSGIQCLPL